MENASTDIVSTENASTDIVSTFAKIVNEKREM